MKLIIKAVVTPEPVAGLKVRNVWLVKPPPSTILGGAVRLEMMAASLPAMEVGICPGPDPLGRPVVEISALFSVALLVDCQKMHCVLTTHVPITVPVTGGFFTVIPDASVTYTVPVMLKLPFVTIPANEAWTKPANRMAAS